MKKLKLTFLWCLLAGLLPLIASAGTDPGRDYQAKKPDQSQPSAGQLWNKAPLKISGQSETELHGLLLWSNAWQALDQWAYPYGVYNFSETTLSPVLEFDVVSNALTAVMANGSYYVVSRDLNSSQMLTNITITKYNPIGGTVEGVIDIPEPKYSKLPMVMAHDERSGLTYALSYTDDNQSNVLATIDLSTGNMSTIGVLGNVSDHASYLTFSVGGDGKIYSIATDGNLYAIDTTTAEVETVGATGVHPAYLQSTAFDPNTGVLWWAATLYDGSAGLYTVDTATGAASLVGPFSDSEEFIGLYINAVNENPDAPAKCIDLEFVATEPGSTTGSLMCIVPEATIGGTLIEGNLDVAIAVDGKVVRTISAEPGESISEELTVETGMRTFSVIASVNGIEGLPATISTWVGTDAPAPVTSLYLSDYNGEATLSWIAPTAGQHGGYCPLDEVCYRVTRWDGTVAAEAITGTTFTEKFPDLIGEYFYSVTSYIPGKGEGIAIKSNSLNAGSYLAVPAAFDFNLDSYFYSYFTIIDNNNDGYTWQHSYTWNENVAVAQYPTSWMNGADDYLVLPGIKFDKETVYSLTFDNSFTSYSRESIAVFAGKSIAVEDLNIELANYEDINLMPTTRQEVRFSFPEEGVYYLAFYIYSDAGQSYFSIDNVNIEAIGPELAPAVVPFTASTLAEGDGEVVKLSITCPEKTISGEALQSVTSIEVYRGDATEPVHTVTSPAIGSTVDWIDVNPGSGPVAYRVVAYNEKGCGEWSSTEIFVGGLVPPYEVAFDSPVEIEYFTILNLNADDKTWQLENGAMVYSYNLFEPADDWLMSPRLNLSSERVYQVIATAHTNTKSESLAITIGPDCEPANHTVLLDLPAFTSMEPTDLTSWIKVPGNGCYNLGFHAYSAKNLLYIYLDNLKVIDVASINAPDEVTDLKVTADPSGDLSATVSMNAPAVSCKGDNLTSLSAVEIYRGNETTPAQVFTDVTPGQPLTWTDTQASQGFMTYHVKGINAEGAGLVSDASAYVGHDAPAAVEGFTAKGDATNANATLEWTAPSTGFNDGYVNQASLSYNIYRGESIYSLSQIASGVTETGYTDNLQYTGMQSPRTYVIEACSDAGVGGRDTVTVALGKLYDFPLIELFSGYLSSEWSNTILTNYNASWMVSTEQDGIESVDPASGFLQFHKWSDDASAALGVLASPKVAMAGSSSPYLSMSFYHNPDADPRKVVTVGYRVNDGDFITLDRLVVNDGEPGWKEYSWPVVATPDDFVSIVFYGESYDNLTRIFIDNISLDDRLDHNLTLDTFDGPIEIGADGATFTVTVRNKGLMTADEFDVALLCDGEPVATIHDTALQAGDKKTYEFPVDAPAATEAGSQRIYTARVDYTADMKPADNTSSPIACDVLTSPYPGVTTLTATVDKGNIALSWETPATSWSPAITESFEDYEPFSISDMGEWILYDGDGQRTIGLRYGLTFTNWYTPKAWQVWDPIRAGLLGDDVAPNTGNLCLISICSDGTIPGDDAMFTPANDDWLISEEISGGSDISFYLKQPVNYYGGNDAVQVLYSTTTQNPDQFILIETIELEGMAQWNRYRITLPDDAVYFAIRHHQSYFGIWLDDITYSPVRVARDITIERYNIYRDGELIGTSSTENYVDSEPLDGVHTYAVAPKFDVGEGRLSNEVEIDASQVGIADMDAGNQVEISTIPGNIIVKTPASCHVGVYTTSGQLISATTADNTATIPVVPGIYIVKAGTTVKKVIVK